MSIADQEAEAFQSGELLPTYIEYLSYNDVSPQTPQEHESYLSGSLSAQRYTAEFRAMILKYGEDTLVLEARKAVQELRKACDQIAIEPSVYGQSKSWFLWHAAKERFLAEHPEAQQTMPNADRYSPIDPLKYRDISAAPDERARANKMFEEIVNSHLGWEIRHGSPTSSRPDWNIADHLDPGTPPEIIAEINQLMQEPLSDGRQSLPAYKLQRLGELVTAHLPHEDGQQSTSIVHVRERLLDRIRPSRAIQISTPLRRSEQGHFRATNRAQFEREAQADAGTLVVESSFNNVDGGTVITYTGLGRSIQRQEWKFDPTGKLVGMSLIDAVDTEAMGGNFSGQSARTYFTNPDFRTQKPSVSTARTITLERDPNDESVFRVAPGSENFDGGLVQKWNQQREANKYRLFSRKTPSSNDD